MDISSIKILNECNKIALYGLGVETERFISMCENHLSICGLLDGFKEHGEIYGYPIISLTEAVSMGVQLIIVVARPGSCKAIAKKIGPFCKDYDIALYDVRGKNLLEVDDLFFDFSDLNGECRNLLHEKCESVDVVSFDLFDTLIARKVFSRKDIFDLVDLALREMGIFIPDFTKLRVYAEDVLSENFTPTLKEIYSFVLEQSGGAFISADELSDMEWQQDKKTFIPRKDMCDVLNYVASLGKIVVITTDSYYSETQIRTLLDETGLRSVGNLMISCECGTSKRQSLFKLLKDKYVGKKIIHIGDDEISDVVKAAENGIDSFRIYSGVDLYHSLGCLGIGEEMKTLVDRIKVGMLISAIFNSPFWFEKKDQRLSVNDSSEVGYLFCAPIITDFILWIRKKSYEQGIRQILFCSRDGYLPGSLFRVIQHDNNSIKSIYFLSSRTAAIRAGVENDSDIEYVDSMNYSGTSEEELKSRYGISLEADYEIERSRSILLKAEIQRNNYLKYISKFNLSNDTIGMFDFVAKGTTQMYLQRLFSQHVKGFYFLQLEPEFMSNKNVDIESFYSDEEKNSSAIFENYYILETILTSPYPQVEEFDELGEARFLEETRSKEAIKVVERAQDGIVSYFEEYLSLVPEKARIENKILDEKMLALVNRIQILDDDFMNLKVEDPFFGRMTDIKDVIG